MQEFNEVFRTCDKNGGLMPSYLNTEISDRMKAAGLVEDFVDEETGFAWQRLTALGKQEAAKIVR